MVGGGRFLAEGLRVRFRLEGGRDLRDPGVPDRGGCRGERHGGAGARPGRTRSVRGGRSAGRYRCAVREPGAAFRQHVLRRPGPQPAAAPGGQQPGRQRGSRHGRGRGALGDRVPPSRHRPPERDAPAADFRVDPDRSRLSPPAESAHRRLIVLVILEGSVSPAALFAAGVAASAVGLAQVLMRIWRLAPVIPWPSPGLLRAHLVYGLKSYLACLFAYLVVRFDLLMVQHMLGARQTGYYSIAASMADLVYLLPSIIGTLLFPKLVARATREEKWRLTAGMSGLVLVLMMGVSGIAALFARPVIRLLFGADFLPAAPAFVLLAIAMIFYGVNNIVSSYLASMSFPWFSVLIWIVACALNVGLNLFWIPAYGIMGASLSSLVCYVLVLVAQVVYCAWWHPGHAS
ncbi:MAG: hypothetical protein DMF51_00445 [Acidobacteria bacterium]|nr:MAG: hypothetical protein DMF51_00445 [Acidobacteriota bacterium]